jgi:hypothetical protein
MSQLCKNATSPTAGKWAAENPAQVLNNLAALSPFKCPGANIPALKAAACTNTAKLTADDKAKCQAGGKRRKASSKKSSKSKKQRGGKCINGVDWEIRDAQGKPTVCGPPQAGGKRRKASSKKSSKKARKH